MDRVLAGFSRLLSWLPAAWLDRIAWAMAVLAFDILRLRRGVILSNLKIALGDEYDKRALVRIGRRSVYHFILTAFEFFLGPYRDITGQTTFTGEQHLAAALAKQQGVYLVGCHLGNWEAMGAAISRKVKPVHIIVKKVGGEKVNRYVEHVRRINGFRWIERRKKGDAYIAMRQALANQEMVGFVFDQARPGEPRLPFFNRPAKTNTSLAAIRQRLPAPIVPVYPERLAFGQHVIHFGPEVSLPASDDGQQDILDHSTKLNHVVEGLVRRHPEQYFWFHNRWK
jgi:KDO2-lipid IV(A) lauroyltransferase